MSHRVRVRILVASGLFLLAALSVPLGADAGDEDGWERLERVPAWVTHPPAAEGKLRAVDVGLSNLLDLAYSPDRILRDRLNLRWLIERRLRRLLGAGAEEPARAGARAATVVRKGFHHQRAKDPEVVGGQVYSAFVLWETPLSAVLAAIPEAQRDAAVVALRARELKPAWAEVAAQPAWVAAPPVREGMFIAVAEERSSRADVARAVADLRGKGFALSAIRGRLRFHLGNDRAYDAAENAVSHATLLERAWTPSPARAWMLYAIPVERILEAVPEAARDAVTRALGEPIPPAPWSWQAVDAEPDWVQHPPQWPDHLAYVQTASSEQADVARQQSIRAAEREIHEHLAALLQPVVGYASADRAARAGAARRDQGAHALHEREAGPGSARAIGTRLVTAWTLWQIPIANVLGELDPKHHAAAREALTP